MTVPWSALNQVKAECGLLSKAPVYVTRDDCAGHTTDHATSKCNLDCVDLDSSDSPECSTCCAAACAPTTGATAAAAATAPFADTSGDANVEDVCETLTTHDVKKCAAIANIGTRYVHAACVPNMTPKCTARTAPFDSTSTHLAAATINPATNMINRSSNTNTVLPDVLPKSTSPIINYITAWTMAREVVNLVNKAKQTMAVLCIA